MEAPPDDAATAQVGTEREAAKEEQKMLSWLTGLALASTADDVAGAADGSGLGPLDLFIGGRIAESAAIRTNPAAPDADATVEMEVEMEVKMDDSPA